MPNSLVVICPSPIPSHQYMCRSGSLDRINDPVRSECGRGSCLPSLVSSGAANEACAGDGEAIGGDQSGRNSGNIPSLSCEQISTHVVMLFTRSLMPHFAEMQQEGRTCLRNENDLQTEKRPP